MWCFIWCVMMSFPLFCAFLATSVDICHDFMSQAMFVVVRCWRNWLTSFFSYLCKIKF